MSAVTRSIVIGCPPVSRTTTSKGKSYVVPLTFWATIGFGTTLSAIAPWPGTDLVRVAPGLPLEQAQTSRTVARSAKRFMRLGGASRLPCRTFWQKSRNTLDHANRNPGVGLDGREARDNLRPRRTRGGLQLFAQPEEARALGARCRWKRAGGHPARGGGGRGRPAARRTLEPGQRRAAPGGRSLGQGTRDLFAADER